MRDSADLVVRDAVVRSRGRTVTPAFTDSHTHFTRATGVRAYFVDFRDVTPRCVADGAIHNLVGRSPEKLKCEVLRLRAQGRQSARAVDVHG